MNDQTPAFRLMNNTQRHSIIGRTGSGKSHFGVWLLSHMNWHKQPWVIIDFKGEELFDRIQHDNFKGMTELSLNQKVPRKPGLYIVRPMPHQHEELDKFLWNIHARERTGLFVDEAHMMPSPAQRYGAFSALLTQGRSKRVPIIVITQKPSWVSKFVFSEADFYSVFHLNDWKDKQRVMEFVPADLSNNLPEHHSYWHDVARNTTYSLRPLPDRDTILSRFQSRLEGVNTRWNGFTSHGQSKIGSRWF